MSILIFMFDSRSSTVKAATRKTTRKKSDNFRRTTSFTSSEDEGDKGGPVPMPAESDSDDRDRVPPVTWKVDVKIEKLHKNIVEHKYSQYKQYWEKEEEIRLRKEKGESAAPVKQASKPKQARGKNAGAKNTVKSKPVLSSGSDGDSDSDDILTQFNNRMKKYKTSNKSDDTANQNQAASNSKSPKSEGVTKSPKSAESRNDGVVELSKPTFESSDSEEEDKTELVDMLFNMISEEDPKSKSPEKSAIIRTPVSDSEDGLGKGQEETTSANVDVSENNEDDVTDPDVDDQTVSKASSPLLLNVGLKSFFTVLKHVFGFDAFEEKISLQPEITLSWLENIVDEAKKLLSAASPGFHEEDAHYLSQHEMRSVRVNIANVRRSEDWKSSEDTFVENFVAEIGGRGKDGNCWKSILDAGLQNAKEILQDTSHILDYEETVPSDVDDTSGTVAVLDSGIKETNVAGESNEISIPNNDTSEGAEISNTVNEEPENETATELPSTSERQRKDSVSSDDTITISSKTSNNGPRSRKSSGSSADDIKISSKSSKMSEPKRRSSLSSDESLKVSNKARDRSMSSSSDISVKDLIRGKAKKRTVSESSDDSIVITRKDSKRPTEKKISHQEEKSHKSERHKSKDDSRHKKKKHKRDRDRDRHHDDQKAYHNPGFKIPRDKDKKEKEKESKKEESDVIKDKVKVPVVPKSNEKKSSVEEIVEKSKASDPGISSILSDMDKLSRSSSKKKKKEKKKKRERDKHREKGDEFKQVGSEEEEEDLPLPVPAADELDDLPAPVAADIEDGGLDDDLPLPVPSAEDAVTSEPPADSGTVCDDFVEDLPDNNDDMFDGPPLPPASPRDVSSDEDSCFVSRFPQPVRGVKRRSLNPPKAVSMKPVAQESGQDISRGSEPRQIFDEKTLNVGYREDTQFNDDFGGDRHADDNVGEHFVDTLDDRGKEIGSHKIKPILKEKRDEEAGNRGHFSRAKVSFNVSDSDIERTDSDRSRTPSPFLSTNKYYPWLYNKEEEGLELDNIKINDNDDMAEDEESSRDSPVIQETKKSNKDRPKERQTKKKEERTEDDAAREAAKKKGLGTFFDKVISSLKTVTAPAPVPPPPQPPLPPQPVPSPYLHAAPPPPRAPPQQQPPPPAPPSPSRIPLPPATPRYTESPEPGEITEAEERREVGHRQPPPPPPPAAGRWGRGGQYPTYPPPDRHGGHPDHQRGRDLGGDGRGGDWAWQGKRKYSESAEDNRKRFSHGGNDQYTGYGSWGDRDRRQDYGHRRSPAADNVDTESPWLDKFLIAWQELISNQEYYVRRDLAQADTPAPAPGTDTDLGAMFAEPQLNTRVREAGGGERPLYSCDTSSGAARLTCTACQVTATGIRSLQSHMGGKKHLARLAELEVIGQTVISIA